GEVERCQSPGERVVQVVDQAGLAAGAQHGVTPARLPESLAQAALRRRGVAVCELLVRDVGAGVADGKDADEETRGSDRCRADPNDRARCVAGCERAAREGGGGETEVAGGFVQAERESAASGTGEV